MVTAGLKIETGLDEERLENALDYAEEKMLSAGCRFDSREALEHYVIENLLGQFLEDDGSSMIDAERARAIVRGAGLYRLAGAIAVRVREAIAADDFEKLSRETVGVERFDHPPEIEYIDPEDLERLWFAAYDEEVGGFPWEQGEHELLDTAIDLGRFYGWREWLREG